MARALILDPSRTGRDADSLKSNLRRLVVGQDEAVEQIVTVYQTHLAGMNASGRPVGSFLFLGPTGSGKTRIVEATAEALVRNARAVIKIDCGEFQHSHEIAKLIGSPPGYLGHRETHALLSQEALNEFHTDQVKLSFVLFDEVEKASDSLWNLLLGILDKATLTLGDNRRVDFSNCMVFLTGNLGAKEMGELMNPKLGFGAMATARAMADGTSDDAALDGRLQRTAVEAARRKFTPEFMNRLDKIVTFHPLGKTELKQIVEIELRMVQQRVLRGNGEKAFIFKVSDNGRKHLLNEGTDLKYGARHLKRAIERLVVQPMSNLLATDQIRGGDSVSIDYEDGAPAMMFAREAEGLSHRYMAEITGNTWIPPITTAAGASAYGPPEPRPARSSRKA
jgi:ATP-dependent Clp protease ATP-binding subunit ClpB